MLKLAQGRVRGLEFLPSRRRYRHQWSVSPGGGIIVDLSRHMNQILEINLEQGWVRARAGW